MHNDTLQTAIDIVDRSSLSLQDRAMWKEKLSGAPIPLIRLFVQLLQEDSSLFELMTKNLKQKMAAKSDEDFAAIFAEEARTLRAITN